MVIDANEAGNSTLLMMLMGVPFPDSGEVLVVEICSGNKKDITDGAPEIRKVFQGPDDQ